MLLKINWPLEGVNFGPTLPMFIKTKNLVPLPSKNTIKNFLLANTKLTSATKIFNFSIYLKLDTCSLLFQLRLLFVFPAYRRLLVYIAQRTAYPLINLLSPFYSVFQE